jgi:hypothetical protein
LSATATVMKFNVSPPQTARANHQGDRQQRQHDDQPILDARTAKGADDRVDLLERVEFGLIEARNDGLGENPGLVGSLEAQSCHAPLVRSGQEPNDP